MVFTQFYSFPTWCSAFKRVSVDCGDRPAVQFPCCVLGQGTLQDCFYLWVVRLVVTGGSVTRRSKRSLRCLLVEVSWQIYEYLPTTVFHNFTFSCYTGLIWNWKLPIVIDRTRVANQAELNVPGPGIGPNF